MTRLWIWGAELSKGRGRWRQQPEHLGEVERLGVVDVEDLNGKQNEVWND